MRILEITDRPEKYEKINKKLDKFGISSQEKKSSLLYKIRSDHSNFSLDCLVEQHFI